jgi:hypothetical protein
MIIFGKDKSFLIEKQILFEVFCRKRPYRFGNWLSMWVQQHQLVSPIVPSFHQIDAFGV